MRHARYEIVHQESDNGTLVLRDLGPHDQFATITNRAEQVVADLHRYGVLQGRRLLYYDSAGELTEILHDNDAFAGFGFPKGAMSCQRHSPAQSLTV